jgi:FkbM family methyltransferase
MRVKSGYNNDVDYPYFILQTMMIALKKSVHKVFSLFGLDIIKHGHFDQSFGAHLLKVLTTRNIDCVVDVGANIGQYGLFLRQIGYTGHIISFEPVKSVFEELLRNSESDPNWICFNLALSDESKFNEINVYEGTQFCSFLEVSDYAKTVWSDVAQASKETVQSVRLDDIFPDLINKVQCSHFYLKLDTQGFDLNVFRGAGKSLRHIHAMQSELSLIPVYEGMVRSFAGIEQYRDAGFFISGMFPINTENSLAVIEYDCVLVRRHSTDFL